MNGLFTLNSFLVGLLDLLDCISMVFLLLGKLSIEVGVQVSDELLVFLVLFLKVFSMLGFESQELLTRSCTHTSSQFSDLFFM